jgi:hypothetical protein
LGIRLSKLDCGRKFLWAFHISHFCTPLLIVCFRSLDQFPKLGILLQRLILLHF